MTSLGAVDVVHAGNCSREQSPACGVFFYSMRVELADMFVGIIFNVLHIING